MDKRQQNKIKNKTKKQTKALKLLRAARREGKEIGVVEAILHGNQFVRQVVFGKQLCDGVEQFNLTEDETKLLDAAEDALTKLYPNEKERAERRKKVSLSSIGRRPRPRA